MESHKVWPKNHLTPTPTPHKPKATFGEFLAGDWIQFCWPKPLNVGRLATRMDSADETHDAELNCHEDGDDLSVVSSPKELWNDAQHCQSNTLLSLDAGLRVRVPLTTMEGDKLKERMGHHFSDGQVALAITCFGHPDGRAATKNLWRKEMEIQKFNWEHNEGCSTILPDFTMAKSLLLSSRALQGGRPEVTSESACFCLPRDSYHACRLLPQEHCCWIYTIEFKEGFTMVLQPVLHMFEMQQETWQHLLLGCGSLAWLFGSGYILVPKSK